MARLGHQRLVSAAYHHHGGWSTVVQRLGFSTELAPSRTAHLEPGVGRGRQPGPLADWDTFVTALREAVQRYRKLHRRTPTQDELIASGSRSIVQAAHRHHQGLRHAMRFLKFRRVRRPRRCPSGLNDWDIFAGQARPVWSSFINRHRRLPSKRELLELGYGALVYAAHQYHDGLLAVHHRLGFGSVTKQQRRRRVQHDWSNSAVRFDWLSRQFPNLVRWGIAPTRAMTRKKGSGLVAFSRTYPGKWPALMKSHGLLSHRDGTYLLKRAEVVHWALDWYEHHGRWPFREVGPHVGDIQYPRSVKGWLTITSMTAYPRPMLLALVERWRRHLIWIRQHQPHEVSDRQQRLNHLIIDSNLIAPTYRLE